MLVLIVDANQQDREIAARHMHCAGHDVITAVEASAALTFLGQRAPDVIIVDSLLQGMTPLQFVQRVRRRDPRAHEYIIFLSSRPCPVEITAAFAAGVDDYIRKPILREELVARVGTLERIRKWAPRVFAGPAAMDWSTGTDLSKLLAWRRLAQTMSGEFEGVFGVELQSVASENALSGVTVAAQIPLTYAAEQVEIHLAIGFDPATVRQIAAAFLRDVPFPDDAMRDLVRETVNTAAGVFKRSMLLEGITLTAGLPCDVSGDTFGASNATARQQFILRGEAGSFRLAFDAEIAPKGLSRVTTTALREGMVVARNLHSEAGALLVPAGTRLTTAHIEKIAHLVSACLAIDVMDVA
jgi:DNA-binding response OmpR family regulator